MFATLISQVRAITGSSTGETSNTEVQGFLQNGIRHVLTSLPVQLSFPFASDSSSITSAVAITIDTNKLLTVERDSIDCVQVPESLGYEIGDSNSIHLATTRYPAFYLTGNSIYIKPDPTTAATAKAIIIDIPAIVTSATTTATSSIGQYDHVVVKYAAYLDSNSMATYLLKEGSTELNGIMVDITSALAAFVAAIPTYTSETFTVSGTIISSALASAESLISGSGSTYLVTEEDTELVASTVQMAQQEINRANAAIQNELMEIKDFDSKVAQKIQQFKVELDAAMAYLQKASVSISSATVLKEYKDQAAVYSQMARELFKECQYIMNNYTGVQNDSAGSAGASRQ